MILTSELRSLGETNARKFRNLVRESGLESKYYDTVVRLPDDGEVTIERTEGLQPPIGVQSSFLDQVVGACSAVRDYLGSPSFLNDHLDNRLRQSTISLVGDESFYNPALAGSIRNKLVDGYRPFLIYDVLACQDGNGNVVPRLLEAQTGWGYVGYVRDLVDAAVRAGIEPARGRYHYGADPSASLERLKNWANTGGAPVFVMDYDPLGRSTSGDIIHLARELGSDLPLCVEDVVRDPSTSLPAFRKRKQVPGGYEETDEIVRPEHVICRSTPLDIRKLRQDPRLDAERLELLQRFFANAKRETTFLLHPLMYDLINKNHLGVLRKALVKSGSPFADQIGRTLTSGENVPFGDYVLKPDDGNSGYEVRHVRVVKNGEWQVPMNASLTENDSGGNVWHAGETVTEVGEFRLERTGGDLPHCETIFVAGDSGWSPSVGYNVQERYRPATCEAILPDGSSVEVQVEVRALALPTVTDREADSCILLMARLAPFDDGRGGIAHTNVRGGMQALDKVVESRVKDGSLKTASEVRRFYARATCAGMMPCRAS